MTFRRVEDLSGTDVDISTDVRTTIRELTAGDYYIPIRLLRRHGKWGLIRSVRMRTEDPFKSETVLGTRIKTYPSDKVHPVKFIVNNLLTEH